MTIEPPEGFTKVTQKEFLRRLNAAAAIDPMPVPQREFTLWKTQKGPLLVWGWSFPGWNTRGAHRYAIKDSTS